MRFAFFPFGSRGDVQPVVALGRTLRAQGHEVLVGTAPTFSAMVESAGLSFHPAGADFEAWLRTQGEALSHRPARLLRELGAFIERDVPNAFAATLEAARDADLIVGVSLQQAAPSIAAHLGKPFRELVYCPQTLPSGSWPPLNVRWMEMPAALNRASWWSTTLLMNRMLRGPVNKARASLGLPPVKDVVAHLRTDAPVVCADPPLAGPLPSELSGPIATGALVPDDAPALAPEVEAFLAAGSPPLYVGFGSMSGRDPQAATEAVVAVARRLSVRLVIARGWGGLAPPAKGSSDVLCIDGAPHTRLFPRCRFVVHHGGAGTTTAAARAGVPQLVVAHAADQYFWGERVRALGVGPARLDRPMLSEETLFDRLSSALPDDVLTFRARALARELAGIDGNALTAARLIEDAKSGALPGARLREGIADPAAARRPALPH